MNLSIPRGNSGKIDLRPGIFTLLLILMSFTTTTSAQHTCGTLDAESCTLLNNTATAMSHIKSLVFEVDSQFEFEDINTTGLDSATLYLDMDGSYRIGEERVALFARPMEKLQSRIEAINAEVEIEFGIPTFGLSAAAVAADLRLVGGIGYLNADDFFTLIDPNDARGWFAFDIIEALPGLVDDGTAQNLVTALTQPQPGFADNMALEYTTRHPDTHLDGEPMVVFETKFALRDMVTNLGSGAVERELLRMLEEQYGSIYSQQNLEDAASAYMQLFEVMEFQWTQTIGLLDNYLHRFVFSFEMAPGEDIDIDPDADPLGASLFVGGRFAFELDLRLSEFDNAPEATAPADSTIITLDDLIPLFTPGSPL